MKKQFYSLLTVAMLAGFTAIAQEDKKPSKSKSEKREKKEVSVNSETTDGRKTIVTGKKINDGKAEKTIIVVDGDNVTINGKPAKDFEGRMDYMHEHGFDEDFNVHVAPGLMNKERSLMRNFNKSRGNQAMLGVVSEKNEKGAVVTEVIKESAAGKAGLKEGDVIISINSDRINEENDLVELIGKYKPDETVNVLVLRDGKEKKLNAKLSKNDSPPAMAWNWNSNDNFRPAMPRIAKMPPMPRAFNFNQDNWPLIDFRSDRPKFGISIADNEDGDGVKITDVKDESNAAKAGLKEGDLVTEVNGNAVKNTDDLKKQLSDVKDKTEVFMKVLRNGSSQTMSVKVPKKIKTADL